MIAFVQSIGEKILDRLASLIAIDTILNRHLKAVERRLEIMSDICADLAHAFHQPRNALQRIVDLDRQEIHVVAPSAQRDAPQSPDGNIHHGHNHTVKAPQRPVRRKDPTHGSE